MAHSGLLGNYQFETAEDIRGATLYGWDDEKLGKIDDVIFDHSSGDIRYIVVDTGGWLTTKKFIVPAARLRVSTKHRNDFSSDLTKKQVENFPAYDEKHLESDQKWKDYEDRYRSQWEADPVMHREGTDRNITPTTQQLEGNRSSLRAAGESYGSSSGGTGVTEEDVEAAATPTERVVSAGTDSVIITNSAVGIGARFDTFQDRLRERRKEAVTGCTSCSPAMATSRENLKKAV